MMGFKSIVYGLMLVTLVAGDLDLHDNIFLKHMISSRAAPFQAPTYLPPTENLVCHGQAVCVRASDCQNGYFSFDLGASRRTCDINSEVCCTYKPKPTPIPTIPCENPNFDCVAPNQCINGEIAIKGYNVKSNDQCYVPEVCCRIPVESTVLEKDGYHVRVPDTPFIIGSTPAPRPRPIPTQPPTIYVPQTQAPVYRPTPAPTVYVPKTQPPVYIPPPTPSPTVYVPKTQPPVYIPPPTPSPTVYVPKTQPPVYIPPPTPRPTVYVPQTPKPTYLPPTPAPTVYVPPRTQAPVYIPPPTPSPTVYVPKTQPPVYIPPPTPSPTVYVPKPQPPYVRPTPAPTAYVPKTQPPIYLPPSTPAPSIFIPQTQSPIRPTNRPRPIVSTRAPIYIPPTGPTRGEDIKSEPIYPTRKPIYLPPRPTYGEDIKSEPIFPAPAQIPQTCAAALKCTPIDYCTAEGVISKTPVSLTPNQELFRVPLTDCSDEQSGLIGGKCCRDPDYVDPWPTNLLASGQYDPSLFQ